MTTDATRDHITVEAIHPLLVQHQAMQFAPDGSNWKDILGLFPDVIAPNDPGEPVTVLWVLQPQGPVKPARPGDWLVRHGNQTFAGPSDVIFQTYTEAKTPNAIDVRIYLDTPPSGHGVSPKIAGVRVLGSNVTEDIRHAVSRALEARHSLREFLAVEVQSALRDEDRK